jgi:hypothetical protein
MTGGLGRTPGIRAALPLAPDEVGVSADRYTPVPDRAGDPAEALGAKARGRAPNRGTAARDWHRMCWAGPGTPVGWQLRGIADTAWLSLRRLHEQPDAAWPHSSGPVIVVMMRAPHHEDPWCGI